MTGLLASLRHLHDALLLLAWSARLFVFLSVTRPRRSFAVANALLTGLIPSVRDRLTSRERTPDRPTSVYLQFVTGLLTSLGLLLSG